MRREFVANASHELRSPLTVLTGYLEAMRDDSGLEAQWGAPLAEMQRQAERMRGIVQDLLELSRLESGGGDAPMEEVDVPGLLTRLREEALALGYGPTDVNLHIDSDLHLLGAEPELYSAFSNIIFNAMKFTPEDGRVDIRWHADGDDVCMSVSDTGRGIAAEHLPRLTERFYRVDKSRQRAQGGTGLGLAIVKHALQRHDAHLEISSAVGKGSEFVCRFPADRVAPGESRLVASQD
jgi:two-component system phosphate regulon sensor histidine kinase PhoR